VKIVDGARRVRILGLDLSRNKASTTGSFEITGFSDGDINISANNLQQPSSTSELPAANGDAAFHTSKLKTARFYVTKILPEAGQHFRAIMAGAKPLMDMAVEEF
jgi:hypothetical protein